MFLKVTDNRVKVDRQERLRFCKWSVVAFYLKGYENYVPDMDNFLITEGTLLITQSAIDQEKIKNAFINL